MRGDRHRIFFDPRSVRPVVFHVGDGCPFRAGGRERNGVVPLFLNVAGSLFGKVSRFAFRCLRDQGIWMFSWFKALHKFSWGTAVPHENLCSALNHENIQIPWSRRHRNAKRETLPKSEPATFKNKGTTPFRSRPPALKGQPSPT